MGRGRQKAKQTKVARDLKYQTFDTDFGALAREMHSHDGAPVDTDVEEDEVDDKWADFRTAD